MHNGRFEEAISKHGALGASNTRRHTILKPCAYGQTVKPHKVEHRGKPVSVPECIRRDTDARARADRGHGERGRSAGVCRAEWLVSVPERRGKVEGGSQRARVTA
ncbi:hypothetical protein EVAR_83583_1 [Eumeta japonica]|uniref:Uncharacterized protein n=1 Tax=Eumeta variegata TaxID=151549 RepID=A0A4C1UQ39_EUMVA|nr:hypothetical protein EVAR_83583_1 [Eumeta japonica]